jgi:hypothetical protein
MTSFGLPYFLNSCRARRQLPKNPGRSGEKTQTALPPLRARRKVDTTLIAIEIPHLVRRTPPNLWSGFTVKENYNSTAISSENALPA